MRTAFAFLLTAGVVAALGWIAFSWAFGPDTHVGQGRIAGFRNDSTVTIEHEQIPGYMPAMIMPLTADPDSVLDGFAEGDAVEFELTVRDETSRITALRALPDTAVARHPAQTVRRIDVKEAPDHRTLREGDSVPPDLALLDQNGDSLRLGDYSGQRLVLTFIYTRCPLPEYCPLMSKRFATLQPDLRTEYGTNAQLLSLSFDPAHDTPPVLRDYAARYTDRLDTWTFATGDSASIQRATNLFGVSPERDGDEIVHNLTTAVIAPDGTVHRLFRGQDWTPKDVLQAVERAR